MFPIKDINPRHRFPIITVLIIIINIFIFFVEIKMGPYLDRFITHYGLIPITITKGIIESSLSLRDLSTFFSAMFLHGGWMHLIGNMLYLWIFGDNVEDKLGHLRYLLFYLLCGIGASFVHILIDPFSNIPTIGASGAISGVLGAYMLLFPRARVLTIIPIFLFIQIAELPAFILIGFWFIIQFFQGLLSLGFQSDGMGGVAWWAHIGGFIFGMFLIFPFRKYY